MKDQYSPAFLALISTGANDLPKDDVGHASAGCLVGESRDRHRAFMALIKSDPRYVANNGYKFVTGVIPGTQALAPATA